MLAEIITIGDEILIGQILDTNSKWIAEELSKIGISVFQITSIQDEKQHIIDAVKNAQNQADIIIITGGLGPTKDDITKHTLTNLFDDELQMNTEIKEHIKQLFAKINYNYTDLDLQQAMLPKKAIVLKNNLGTASGMWFHHKNKTIISLPGVPNEMKGLMMQEVLPKIKKDFKLPYILHKTLITYGMGESNIAKKLSSFEENLPKEISLAYLPSYGKTRLRLTTKGNDKTALEISFNKTLDNLKELVKDILIGSENNQTIEKELGKLLKEKKLTIATAESCTGGNIAKMLTSIPGSSAYFIGSIVSYSAKIKTDFLNVSKETIKNYSVVSEQVAKEMAENIRKQFRTDIAISVTGNAGPTTDKTDKTVGDVFIGIATPNKTIVKFYNFGQPRLRVIEKASVKALELVYRLIE